MHTSTHMGFENCTKTKAAINLLTPNIFGFKRIWTVPAFYPELIKTARHAFLFVCMFGRRWPLEAM